jgi:2-keto-3-deoxy-galactonokinase
MTAKTKPRESKIGDNGGPRLTEKEHDPIESVAKTLYGSLMGAELAFDGDLGATCIAYARTMELFLTDCAVVGGPELAEVYADAIKGKIDMIVRKARKGELKKA